VSRTSSPRVKSPPSPLARLQQALEERHGWKRLDDEDPEEAAATAAALANAPIGTAVTVPTRQVDVLTVRWTRKTSRATRGHKARTGRHESRPARPGGRRTSSSSRTSSADPPGESEPSDPEPPAHGRLCAALWCSHPVYGASQKRYCGTPRCDEARAEERQRRHRHGDDLSAQEREALAAARAARMVGGEAFALGLPAEPHSLSFLWKFRLVDGPDPGELEALLNRPPCRCNGHHIDGGAVGCFKCGLSREAVAL